MDPVQLIANYLTDNYSYPYLVSYGTQLNIPDITIIEPDELAREIAEILFEAGYDVNNLPITGRNTFPIMSQTQTPGGRYGSVQHEAGQGQYDGMTNIDIFGSTRGMSAFTTNLGYTVPEDNPDTQPGVQPYEVPLLEPPMFQQNDTQNKLTPYYRQPPLGEPLQTEEEEEEWTGNISNRIGAATSTYGIPYGNGGSIMNLYRSSNRYPWIYTTGNFATGVSTASQYGGSYDGVRPPIRNRAPCQYINKRGDPCSNVAVNPSGYCMIHGAGRQKKGDGLAQQFEFMRDYPPVNPLPRSNNLKLEKLRQLHNQKTWQANGRYWQPTGKRLENEEYQLGTQRRLRDPDDISPFEKYGQSGPDYTDPWEGIVQDIPLNYNGVSRYHGVKHSSKHPMRL